MIFSKKHRATLKRVLWVFIPAVLVLVVGIGGLAFYMIHRLAHPPATQLYGSPRDFQIIMQKPMWYEEKWNNSDSTQTVGWFLSRDKAGPAIILSHGYGSNRSELLTLSFELWKAGYHVLVYDLRGHGESPVKWSGLGTYEKDDLLSAIKFLKERKNESGQLLLDGRVGLYGVDVGGYISLVASAQDPMVKAIAVDSVYPDVAHFINSRLKTIVGSNSLGNRLVDSSWTGHLSELAMQLYLLRREDTAPAIESVSTGAGRRFLFITSKDTGVYDAMTRDLYNATKSAKELVEVDRSRMDRLYEKASSEYDARVVAFFQQAIPLTSEKPTRKK
ncbi:MAG TPA: alpha/beta fold hydrolase [Blastocatellia bacterium]|nr:alpha/beta fold hydrolase [Blastocatellia bacterium]